MEDTKEKPKTLTFLTNEQLRDLGGTFEGEIADVLWAQVFDAWALTGATLPDGRPARGKRVTLPRLVFNDPRLGGVHWTTNPQGRRALVDGLGTDETDEWIGNRVRITLAKGQKTLQLIDWKSP
jgi:hypothetical protein